MPSLIERTSITSVQIKDMKVINPEGGVIRADLGCGHDGPALGSVDFSLNYNLVWANRREFQNDMATGRFSIIEAAGSTQDEQEKLRHAFRMAMRRQGGKWANGLKLPRGN